MLVSPNNWIENASWIIVTNHMESKCFYTIIEVNKPILGDYDRTIFHHILKFLEMFTLVVSC
jgi:hypothetical protein